MNVEPADIWLFPSGMAAIETAFRVFQRLRPDAKSVQFGFPYVDSLKVQQRCGVGVHFFPRGDAAELAAAGANAADEPLLGLFCEFPGNPLLASPDLGADRRVVADKHDFPVLVDDTLGALMNVDVLPAADVVSCSLTKFFSGAGDVIAGSLVLNSRRPGADRLRERACTRSTKICSIRRTRPCSSEIRAIASSASAGSTKRPNDCATRCAPPAGRADRLSQISGPGELPRFRRPGGGYGGLCFPSC